ncbi:MAG: hypothetical protein AVDCRST_MAG33-2507 [uncultured Thermomicrobiales bacterium]|uniref:Uncharacterized protein n=1 Tax=uncultured Thermomicrobiales bacterium TaxID=1645740 RepID=A0A6J4VBF8_9BACT|nr:MAG: hypothetical protein AVDCRST_MAG33-2507 [uncultured Thermomicrobiales bacterium]
MILGRLTIRTHRGPLDHSSGPRSVSSVSSVSMGMIRR